MSEAIKPRIYVASLSDYNAGRLHGVWIELVELTIGEVWQAIDDMLRASSEPGAEEIAIHDYDGFAPLQLGEYEQITLVYDIALGMQSKGTAFAAWAQIVGSSEWMNRLDDFFDHYLGRWDTFTEYAEDLLESCGLLDLDDLDIPDTVRPYIRVDVEAFARDIASDYEIVDGPYGGIFIFQP